MSRITLRPVRRRADARLAAEVCRASWVDRYSQILPGRLLAQDSIADIAPWLAEQLRDRRFALSRVAADQSGRVVGVMLAHRVRPGVIEVAQLFVAPNDQGVGAGSALFGGALAAAERRGSRIRLTAVRANAESRAWYERRGGKVIGRHAFRWGAYSVPCVRYEFTP